jgi:hypothetical protein
LRNYLVAFLNHELAFSPLKPGILGGRVAFAKPKAGKSSHLPKPHYLRDFMCYGMADTKFHTIGTHDVWLLTEDQSLEPHRGEWAALKNLAFEELRGEFHVTGAELVFSYIEV